MGFRTVVVLSNDQAHEWENDPELGKKIMHAAAVKTYDRDREGHWHAARHPFQYGDIVEQVHADTQTLAVLDGYGGKPVAYTHWHRGSTPEGTELALLKELANKLGYRVSIKPEVKLARALAASIATPV